MIINDGVILIQSCYFIQMSFEYIIYCYNLTIKFIAMVNASLYLDIINHYIIHFIFILSNYIAMLKHYYLIVGLEGCSWVPYEMEDHFCVWMAVVADLKQIRCCCFDY